MNALAVLKSYIPAPVKLKLWQLAGRHPSVPAVTGLARVLDFYVWISDADVDTLVPVHNYFSVLFPELDTATAALLQLHAADGRKLGEMDVIVPRMGTPTVHVSALLRELGCVDEEFGTLSWDLQTPPAVEAKLSGYREPFLLWDRSYVGYVGPSGQASFVHGIDKARIMTERNGEMPWPIRPTDAFVTTPEIPLLVGETEWTDIIVQNRALAPKRLSLEARDRVGKSLSWSADVRPRGAHRFRLDATLTEGLDTAGPLTLRVLGLPTRYGRAIVFRHFAGGAISAMHC